VAAHIPELAAEGVPTPAQVPAFYPVPPDLLYQDGRAIVTAEPATSGEVEYALVVQGGEMWVAVASDHTDRAAERLDIALSKRACPKIVGRSVWRYADVAAHWDDLQVVSWTADGSSAPTTSRDSG